MFFKKEYGVLVIVGQWNKSIFHPGWVSKYLIPDVELQVEIPLTGDGSTRLSTPDLRIGTMDQRLVFTTLKTTDDVLRKIHGIAYKVADYLPHTPVNAFGVNFYFSANLNEEISKCLNLDQKEKFEPFGLVSRNFNVKRGFSFEDSVLSVAIDYQNISSDECEISLNYHYEITSLIDFKSLLDESRIIQLKEKSIDFMKDMFNLNLIEDENH